MAQISLGVFQDVYVIRGRMTSSREDCREMENRTKRLFRNYCGIYMQFKLCKRLNRERCTCSNSKPSSSHTQGELMTQCLVHLLLKIVILLPEISRFTMTESYCDIETLLFLFLPVQSTIRWSAQGSGSRPVLSGSFSLFCPGPCFYSFSQS